MKTVKATWLSDQASSLDTLAASEEMLRSLDRLFRIEDPYLRPIDVHSLRDPSLSEINSLTGADQAGHANDLFVSIEQNIQTFKLTGRFASTYRIGVAKLYWHFFAEDSFLAADPAVRVKHLELYQAAETQLLELAVRQQNRANVDSDQH